MIKAWKEPNLMSWVSGGPRFIAGFIIAPAYIPFLFVPGQGLGSRKKAKHFWDFYLIVEELTVLPEEKREIKISEWTQEWAGQKCLDKLSKARDWGISWLESLEAS